MNGRNISAHEEWKRLRQGNGNIFQEGVWSLGVNLNNLTQFTNSISGNIHVNSIKGFQKLVNWYIFYIVDAICDYTEEMLAVLKHYILSVSNHIVPR